MIPSCRDFAVSVSTGEIETARWPRRMMLRLHWAACWVCRRYEAQIRFLGEAARKAKRPVDAAALKKRLIEKLGKGDA